VKCPACGATLLENGHAIVCRACGATIFEQPRRSQKQTMKTGNLRAAWLAPCIGTGGADALMAGLARACQTVSFTGVGILRAGQTTQQQVSWARANGLSCPLHLLHFDSAVIAPLDVTTHRTALEAARAAVADADIVISWCCGGDRVDMRAIYPALGVPVVELSQNEDATISDLLAYNAPAAHFYAACSQSAAKAFPENLREKVNVIYNGIDPLRCAPRAGRDAKRSKLELEESDKMVLFLGRFVSEKNPEAIVQALSLLPEHYKAVFVGRGPEQMILENAAKRYAPGRVQMIEFVDHPGDLYAAADCFCLPSDFEGDPLAVHEAQLAGLPCVVAEYSAVDELEKLFGPLYYRVPRRPTGQQMADAIREACESPDERVTRAREVTWRYFTMSSIAFQWEDLLNDCLGAWRLDRLYGKSRRLMQPKPQARPQ
jgi:glycosyltransferase involved in cell wall biosynthesis/DNA-directed RNA polymerase subunit RPC12/RpoP